MKKNNQVIHVVIVDDHRLFNDGLYAMLTPEPTIEVLAQVYDSREAKQYVEKLNPDVVLIDFNMPYLNGIEITKLLLEQNPERKILILSMYNEERHIETFKKTGARGYLFKTASAEDVVAAIQKIDQGAYHFPGSTNNTHSEDDFLKKLKLSNRELEVIQLVKAGFKTKEIAEKLNISFYTAETHRKNIKLKVGLKGEGDFLRFIFGNSDEPDNK